MAILSIVFVLSGIVLRVLCISSKNINFPKDVSVTNVEDLLDASNREEFEKCAKKNSYELMDIEGGGLRAFGYELFDYDAFVDAKFDSNNKINEIEIRMYPFEENADFKPKDLKNNSINSLKKFSERFNTSYDKFYIVKNPTDEKKIYYDKNSLNSYQAIINGEAWLELSIKDKNGAIWLYRELIDYDYGIVFKLYIIRNSEETKYMNYDIDLSQGNSKG